jgi:hypothetical protein
VGVTGDEAALVTAGSTSSAGDAAALVTAGSAGRTLCVTGRVGGLMNACFGVSRFSEEEVGLAGTAIFAFERDLLKGCSPISSQYCLYNGETL